MIRTEMTETVVPRARRARWCAVVAAAVAAGSLTLAGCASVRNDLGTTNSDCYIAIPAADGAVHHHGHLRGVLLVTVASLRHRAPNLYRAATSAPPPRVTRVCLVAFGGTFTDSTVTRPIGQEAGHLAVVELDYPSKRLLATLLIRHVPFGFGHTHI